MAVVLRLDVGRIEGRGILLLQVVEQRLVLASSFSAGGVSLASAAACLNLVPALVWSVTIWLAKALILSFLV
jgi:hypothetical protein